MLLGYVSDERYMAIADAQVEEAWVEERGGRLMYLGGNGFNCEVERLDAATMRCKTHLLSVGGDLGTHDPQDPGIYFESRMHRTLESEANLLGVVTAHTGILTGAPYRVRAAAHWTFAGASLADGDLFGRRACRSACALPSAS